MPLPCENHGALTSDVAWLIKIGYGVFTIGCAIIVLGIGTIFYTGGLVSQLSAAVTQLDRLDARLTDVERQQWVTHSAQKVKN